MASELECAGAYRGFKGGGGGEEREGCAGWTICGVCVATHSQRSKVTFDLYQGAMQEAIVTSFKYASDDNSCWDKELFMQL